MFGEDAYGGLASRVESPREAPRLWLVIWLSVCLAVALTQGLSQLLMPTQFIEAVGLSDVDADQVQFNGLFAMVVGGALVGYVAKTFKFQLEFSARNYLILLTTSAAGVFIGANVGFLLALPVLLGVVIYKYETETLFDDSDDESDSRGILDRLGDRFG
jgi:hypothetical protein